MPLLFYFPFIVWIGMVKVAQDATQDFGEQNTCQPLIQRPHLYLANRCWLSFFPTTNDPLHLAHWRNSPVCVPKT